MEIIQAAHRAWNARDMDAIREMYDPNVIIVRSLEGWPEPAPVVGRDAVMRQWKRQREPWDNADEAEAINVIHCGRPSCGENDLARRRASRP